MRAKDKHGTMSCYVAGGPDGKGCRCAKCKAAAAEYQRNRRAANGNARVNTGKHKPSNVVQMQPKRRTRTTARAKAPEPEKPAAPPEPGRMALAVMQYCAENSVDALTRARMEAMAEIMDDPGKWGQHTAAEAKLAAIMKECAPQRKKAGSKLAQVRAMSSAARNAKGRKASGN